MKEKSPDELFCRHGDTSFLGNVVVVPGQESDRSVGHAHKTVVGYGNLVRVPTQVRKDVFGPCKRFFCVEVPALAIERFHQRAECLRICQGLSASGKGDLTLTIGSLEIVEKLASDFGR